MLNDATGLKKIYLAAGYTDLRRGMDGLATIIRFQLDPYDKNTLFLFCGKKTDRIKGLLWEGDGFLLLYKRLSNGAFNWPRSVEEALEISPEQYTMLMQGLEFLPKHPIRPNDPPKRLMYHLCIMEKKISIFHRRKENLFRFIKLIHRIQSAGIKPHGFEKSF